jgi:hypothetical protein
VGVLKKLAYKGYPNMKNILLVLLLVLLSGCLNPSTNVKDHKASFLLNNVQYCTLAYLSDSFDDGTRDDMINKCKNNGDTVLYIMTHSENPAENINPFVGDWSEFGVTIDENKMKNWEKRIKRIHDKGLVPVLWMYCDDFGRVKRLPSERRDKYIDEMVKRFDKYVNCYVIGIEEDETMGLGIAQETASRLRMNTKKPIGSHQLPNNSNYAGAIPEVSIHFHQYSLGYSEARMQSETAKHKGLIGGKKFIASEYNRSSESDQAKAQGQAAMRGGADGTGNGR